MKIGRAEKHLAALQADVNIWSASRPVDVKSNMAPDRLSYDVRLRVVQVPPFREWSLALGDVVHNLRSALDSAVGALATESSKAPRNAAQVQFPVVASAEKWEKEAQARLSTVDANSVEAIRAVQPFMRAQKDQAGDGLLLLQHLSNTDKHRVAITATAVPQTIGWDSTIEFEDPTAAERNTPPDLTVHQPDLVDDTLLFEYRALDRIKTAPGRLNFGFQLSVETPVGPHPMIQTLGGLCSYIRQVVALLEQAGTENHADPNRGEPAR